MPDSCLLCDSPDVARVLNLGHHPLADRFLERSDLDRPEIRYPLVVMLCGRCGFAGLRDSPRYHERYGNLDYSYTAGNSPVSVAHFDELAKEIATRCGTGPDRGAGSSQLVVDIGGNDGTFLKAIAHETGCRTFNIEPAVNIAALSTAAGIKTASFVFDHGAFTPPPETADIIVTTNTFNHACDPEAFVSRVSRYLRPGGYFVLEVPSLSELVRMRAFDTIYAEHVSYFGLRSLRWIMARYDLAIVHAETIDYMGGSLRVFAKRGGTEHSSIGAICAQEHEDGIYEASTYHLLAGRMLAFRAGLMSRLREIRRFFGEIVGIGAAAKGNTLLNYCGIDRDLVSCIADTSPLKIGKFTPGSHIPIVAEEAIPARATHGLILPWNIASHLKGKLGHLPLQFISPFMDP